MVSSFSMLLLERYSYKASSEAKVAKSLRCTTSGEATLPFLSWPVLRMWVKLKKENNASSKILWIDKDQKCIASFYFRIALHLQIFAISMD